MDFDKLAYPETITIDGIEHRGKRNMSKGQVLIPYTNKPDVGIGDVIAQKTDKKDIYLKVTDASFVEGGSLGVGTNHPHMLTLKVVNTTAQPHISKKKSSAITIASVSDKQVQADRHSSQIPSIRIQQLVEHVAKSGDEEAKSILKSLLQNRSVARLIGDGARALIGLL